MTVGKRMFDVAGSLIGITLLSPLFLVLAVLVKAQDGGPVFFRQRRVGRHGRSFFLWKFRTMVPHAELQGPALTVGQDDRITRVGAVLRRFKLDELPQLLNVLVGDMSLVGPRPEVPRYVRHYTPDERRILDLVPGMTDPGSLWFRDEAAMLARSPNPEERYLDEVMPFKIRMSLDYAARATRWSDFLTVLRTLAWLRRHGDDGDAGAAQTSGPNVDHSTNSQASSMMRLIALIAVVTSPALAQAPVPASIADPIVSAGDVLRVTVWRLPEFSGEIPVTVDGNLEHPMYQDVQAAGLRLSTVREQLEQFLTRYEREPRVAVELLIPITVGGEVRIPSLYRLPRGATVGDAIAQAGGATELSRLDRVRLIRGPEEFGIDLTDQASQYSALPLQSSDRVFVGRRSTFNFVRDVFSPLLGITAAVASIYSATR